MAQAHTDAQQDPALLRRLLRAKDRMDAASHEAWPVKRLAEVSGVSAAHFARSFKQAFGIPPHRYLLTRRIEQATTLLRDTDLPIIDARESALSAIQMFESSGAWSLPVVEDGVFLGMMSKSTLFDRYRRELIVHTAE